MMYCAIVSPRLTAVTKPSIAYGTLFDTSAGCSVCGAGARQVGALRVSASALFRRKGLVQTSDGDTLIDEQASSALRSKGPIDWLRPVEDARGRSIASWQICAHATLPRLRPTSIGIVRETCRASCKVCDRADYFDGDIYAGEYHYQRGPFEDTISRLGGKASVFCTWENFGVSRLVAPEFGIVRLGKPRLVLDSATADLLDACCKTQLIRIPIKLVD